MVHGDYSAIIDNDPSFLTFSFFLSFFIYFNFSTELLVFAKYNMVWYVCRATGEKDVTFKVLFCGICHSDLHKIKNEWGSSIYPLIPGYFNFFFFFFFLMHGNVNVNIKFPRNHTTIIYVRF